jgi:hypothetical protein
MSAANPHDGARVSWREDPDRWAVERARYVERVTPLDDTDAEIVAYAELGFSSAGIAKRVGLGHSTVTAHFEDIEADCGPTVLLARKPDELDIKTGVGLEGL